MKIAIIDVLGLTYDGYTLEKRGLGGSESAVILMSKELARLGFKLTVFNNCKDSEASSGVYDDVTYVDHSDSHLYKDEIFDIIISSRSVAPFWSSNPYASMVYKAKKRVLWMHDTFCEGDQDIESMLLGGYIDELFTLSDFHTIYVGTCAHGNKRMFESFKHKVFQTRNGAVKYLDVDITQKDRNLFVYNASVTKGLVPLLELVWPEVKKAIPEAKLVVVGGYYRFREGAEPDEQEKTLVQMRNDPRYADVRFTGVIPQWQIAQTLALANFMIYPTAFPETFGISSLESLLYKTPIITTKFGALEETAIAQACYHIDYCVEPNSLYPWIDRVAQAKRFAQTVIAAYHNTYLHDQKRQYCSVVDDIYGWDSIALQWKQHIYTMFEKPLPVDEYREVSRINDKVARVFGRRISNVEDRRVYKSYSKQQKIVVVSPFYNCEKYIANCIESVAQQEYDNYQHILIDDNSNDGSADVAYDTIANLPNSIRDKFIMRTNIENMGALFNQVTAIKPLEGDNIIMLLDGDDWLVNNNTIFHFYNDIYRDETEFTYGSCWSLADNIPLIAQDYPSEIKQAKAYKFWRFAWNMPYTHLRTFRKHLIGGISDTLFMHEKKWMKAGGDGALFYALLEQANPNGVKAVKEIVYKYNDINPLNDYKVNAAEQTENANRILSS